jgi:PAS domain-containing protein
MIQECRISRGVQAMISDSASISVMIEMIGHLTPRWAQIKRQQFISFELSYRNKSESGSTLASQQRSIPRCLTHQESRSQRVFSSMSSSDDLSSVENPVETDNSSPIPIEGSFMGPSKSNSDDQDLANHLREDRSISSSDRNMDEHDASKDFHDYNAMPLPDPKIKDREKRNNSDTSSSGDDSNNTGSLPLKRRKMDQPLQFAVSSLPSNIAKKGGISHNITSTNDSNLVEKAVSSLIQSSTTSGRLSTPQSVGMAKLPSNIAKKGGISHSIRPIGVGGDGESRLDSAPAIVLPPFRGLGNKSSTISSGSNVKGDKSFKTMSSSTPSITPFSVSSSDVDIDSMRSRTTTSEAKTPSLTTTDVEESSSLDDGDACTIRGSYHINQDSQILMGDVLMSPFVFRSHDAVLCGSLSECMMPGMLRAEFSSRNKLKSLELTFDAMGFMQQLARASGNDSTAQIVPSSVEMALIPNATEARVITLAKPPYRVMNVNEQWTRLTGYTQMDAEGKEYLSLIEGEHTLAKSRNGISRHILEDVAKGRPACSTNIHHGKDGTDFLEFVCSFPLTNDSEDVTHILHISKELPTMIRESDY